MEISGCLGARNSILFYIADLCDLQNIYKEKQRVFVFKVKGKSVPVQAMKVYEGSKA
jgi:hypothetical protein